MSGQFPLSKDSDFRLPDFKRSVKSKESWRSDYAKLKTDKKRLKYLHYRDNLMGRNSVTRIAVIIERAQTYKRDSFGIFGIFFCKLCKKVYEISRLTGYKNLRKKAELTYYDYGCSLGKPRKDCPYCSGTEASYKLTDLS